MTTLVALSIVAVLAMAGMWLFTLNQVTDTSAAQAAAAVDASLGRNLEPDAPARVKMVRDGTGLDAPRRYVLRYRPSQAIAADPEALALLAERAAQIVVGRIEAPAGEVTIHCVAELAGGDEALACFRRTGSRGAWNVAAVTPVPPLPTAKGTDTSPRTTRAPAPGDGTTTPPENRR